jgi:Transposase DNA-binding/Transposase Tn5 dimerisation domain
MSILQDLPSWADANFGTVNLGRRDRTQRLVQSVAQIASHPEASFPQIFDWNGLRAFYGLCDRDEATLDTLQAAHRALTHQAMATQPLVLILHDTTTLDFTTHNALDGLGPIGDGNGRGFLQHNSLAIVPAPRQVLGLAYQQLRVREPAPVGETSYQRKKRQNRESVLWTRGIRGVGPAPSNGCWVDVGDRGSDDYLAMCAALEVGHHFLFRVQHNRSVFVSEQQDRQEHLQDYARSLPPVGSDKVEIPGRGGRPERTATVSLASAPVWIPPPKGTRQPRSHPLIAAWVIRIWEPKPPSTVAEPLEWILVCSLPSRTLEELKDRRDWYCCRWLVEIYHDVEKNGCQEEARRFQAAERMESCLAILSVVAIRVLQLRCALDCQPEAPAEQVATATEICVIRQYLKYTSKHLTVREFVRGVARLGGFLGRKADGEPGVRALWRGCQRLQDLVLGYHLHDPTSQRPDKNITDYG